MGVEFIDGADKNSYAMRASAQQCSIANSRINFVKLPTNNIFHNKFAQPHNLVVKAGVSYPLEAMKTIVIIPRC